MHSRILVYVLYSAPPETLKYGTFEFVKSFILCKMDEVDLNLRVIFFETQTLDVKRKSISIMMCREGKKMNLKLTKHLW